MGKKDNHRGVMTISDLLDLYKRLLLRELGDLQKAVNRLYSVPASSLPAPRPLRITPNIKWPAVNENGRILYSQLQHPTTQYFSLSGYYQLIIEDCKAQPRCILRAIEQIRKATRVIKNLQKGGVSNE